MPEVRMKNYMEDCVEDMLPQLMAKLDICQCERCRMDVMAYVLNKLPPKYVVTRKGHLYAKLTTIQTQFEVDIIANVTKAAEIIRANPRHNE